MELSKRQLRKLIREAMYDLRTLPPKAQGIPTSMIGISDQSRKEKLAAISQSPDGGYRQAAELIDALGGTPAVIGMEGGYEGALKKGEHMKDQDLLNAMKGKDKIELDSLGFDYVKDALGGPENDYMGYGDMLSFQAAALGCELEDLAYIESSTFPGDRATKTFYHLKKMVDRMDLNPVPVPTNNNDFGYNQLYNLGGLKILHTDHYLDGYFTYTICG